MKKISDSSEFMSRLDPRMLDWYSKKIDRPIVVRRAKSRSKADLRQVLLNTGARC